MTPSDLRDFSTSFFGFGSFDAPYWCVGIEPLDPRPSIAQRIDAWTVLGRPEIVDRARYYDELLRLRAVRIADRFEPVWDALVTILFFALRRHATTAELDAYARERFGRDGGETAMLDLLAIPLRRSENWVAHELSRDAAYRSRDAYLAAFAFDRIARLHDRIAHHRPRLVIAYGNVHADYWNALFGGRLAVEASVPLRHRSDGETLLVQIPHPLAEGMASEHKYREIGRFLAPRLAA